jgi:chromosome segregation ATPase
LKTTAENYQQLEKELQEAQQQIRNFTTTQKDEAFQHQENIQKFERQISHLMNDLTEKEELVTQLDQLIVEKDQLILEKEDIVQQLIEEQKHQDSLAESELVAQLQHQITTLQKENEQLQQEATQSQHEIGEVLISARRQANRMVEKAKLDAQRIVKDSEAELQTIHDRAKEISCEVDESRQTILSIYEELKIRVDQLAKSNVPDLEEIKGRYEYPKVSVITRKEHK